MDIYKWQQFAQPPGIVGVLWAPRRASKTFGAGGFGQLNSCQWIRSMQNFRTFLLKNPAYDVMFSSIWIIRGINTSYMKNPCDFFPDFLGDAQVAPSEGAPQGRPGLFQLHDPLLRLENGADSLFLMAISRCFFSRLLLKWNWLKDVMMLKDSGLGRRKVHGVSSDTTSIQYPPQRRYQSIVL